MHSPIRCVMILATVLTVALGAAPSRAGIRIYTADDVARHFLQQRGSSSYLVFEDHEWELATDPEAPYISQLGDGSFHPMDAGLVRDAVDALPTFARGIQGTIVILPYPRKSVLKSSCHGDVVFLSPGILEVQPEHVHSTVVHEIGHLMQHARVPENSVLWDEYVKRRGLASSRFSQTAEHSYRPREIFAEDFRVLFGSGLATASGSHENPELPLASSVPGLRSWFADVLGRPAPALADEEPWSAPNPYLGGSGVVRVVFQAGRSPLSGLDAVVVDVTGRRIRDLTGRHVGEEAVFRWDGRDERGRIASSGIYLVRWRQNPGGTVARVHVLH